MICAFLVPKPCHEVDPSGPTKDVFTLKYTIEVAKTFVVVAKNNYVIILRWMQSKLDDIVHFSFTFSMKIILVISYSRIYN
jgi:hypothetical protein